MNARVKTTNADVKRLAGTYVVNVTPTHISNGKGNCANGCPVQVAISEQFPGFKVKVNRTSVELFPDRGNLGLYAKLPQAVIDFGVNLDKGLPVLPISFTLDLKV